MSADPACANGPDISPFFIGPPAPRIILDMADLFSIKRKSAIHQDWFRRRVVVSTFQHAYKIIIRERQLTSTEHYGW